MPVMKLTIIAATGGTGRQLLEQAVAAGHDVTAVVRNPRNLPPTRATGSCCGTCCATATWTGPWCGRSA
jgi:uncharacterized protein YbjT (DUF2867 family)